MKIIWLKNCFMGSFQRCFFLFPSEHFFLIKIFFSFSFASVFLVALIFCCKILQFFLYFCSFEQYSTLKRKEMLSKKLICVGEIEGELGLPRSNWKCGCVVGRSRCQDRCRWIANVMLWWCLNVILTRIETRVARIGVRRGAQEGDGRLTFWTFLRV